GRFRTGLPRRSVASAPSGGAMFPISKPELSFAEISEYWAAELNLSRERVQALLESAWWLGEILGDPTLPTRLQLLKSLFNRMRNRDTPELLFVTSDTILPAKTVERGAARCCRSAVPRAIRDLALLRWWRCCAAC